MSLTLAAVAVLAGLALLVWSADRFVDGAAATAWHAGMPTLLIGMVIIGFGTSAPEMVVSAFSAAQGNPGLALGNAYGSNISNIALILGLTAVISPITVRSSILRKELPILLAVTGFAVWQLLDGFISRADAWALLGVFFVLMGWSILQGMRHRGNSLGADVEMSVEVKPMPLKLALCWTFVGMLLLVVSSRILVWGAVEIARAFGVSDLIIGLTVVAVGTSLPELASSLAATRKGEHDLALGNVLGSNLFNTLAVVGIAGTIHPMQVDSIVLWRDCTVMVSVTLAVLFFGIGFRAKGGGRITRFEGAFLLAIYLSYNSYLVMQVLTAS